MKKILLFCSLMGLGQITISAQEKNDAFVYIQGDKQTPIYVKMEGEMQARYSKDFAILNGLAAGPLHLEVLFQQNAYPAQKFILNIAPSGQRSLVLKKLNNTQFALYDLNNGHYINAGNKVEDDVITTDPNKELQDMLAVNKEPDVANTGKEIADPVQEVPETKPVKAAKPKKEKKVVVVAAPEDTPATPATKEDTRFLDFEMNKEAAANAEKQKGNKRNKKEEPEQAVTIEATPEKPVKKTINCEEGMTEAAFNAFAQRLEDRTDEENKLSYVQKYGKAFCFSTEQVRVVALSFNSQSSRYEVARVLKPRVSDIDHYTELLSLFNTNYLKERFKNEVVGK
ncbi:hypothetical protein DBR32_04740 [Taibaiella sp. KBW10]|uniref:DUF4476 domain-containing protein n=1 Tax=Taibaiella sp. KBW10 TaxID=2153357 RepID=UPI000F5981C4|nr:DUF4476 domain-containing protein [Taibaiella sp. KBW10]RQO31279.1 hypothetical protein DBR32_04740 [Taibaiella sp. KBW10]